jgi:Phage tail tube protein
MPNQIIRGIDTFVSIVSQVLLEDQLAITAVVAAGDTLPFEQESMSGGRQIVVSKAIRRQAMLAKVNSANGTIDASGSIDYTASQVVLAKLLPISFTSTVTLSGFALADPGVVRQTHTLVDGARLTPYTVFIGITGTGAFLRRFRGCKTRSITFNAKVNDFLMITHAAIGVAKEIITLSPVYSPLYVSPSVEYAYFFDGAEVKFKTGAMTDLGTVSAESVDITIDHNLDGNAYRLGSLYRYDIDESQTAVTGSFTVRAGSEATAGQVFNQLGGVTHDRAFFERLNIEARYATIQLRFMDPSRAFKVGSLTNVATQAAGTLTLDEVSLLKVGDTVILGETRVGDVVTVPGITRKITAINTGTKVITLDSGTTGLVAAMTAKLMPGLVIDLPSVRLEEPDFQIKDTGAITGSVKFQAYDSIGLEHVYKI